jgi:two-component system response regulator AtoC
LSQSHSRSRTTKATSGTAVNATARFVLVVGADRMLTMAIPRHGEMWIGRDAECEISLPHERISRRHARLIVGAEVAIEDLGSTNGVRMGGARLAPNAPQPIPIGESVRIGPFTLLLLAGTSTTSGDESTPRAALVVRDPTLAGKTEVLERVAKHDVSVLIQGETGTGKEVLARTLHELSGRDGEMVAINCAALSGALLESELFGHEKGAFTGATRTKTGLLEVAGQGTALLDEIGDLPLELQGKLLRALESRQVYRVGGVQPISLRARVLAATHRDLPDEVARGTFRQDLYFRLNGISLVVAPLRERRSAIAVLAAEFLGRAAKRLTPKALAVLTEHDWPGNVRELRLVLDRAALLAGDGPILPAHVLLAPARAAGETEERRFVALAREHKGNASAIARALNTSRSQVRRLAARYGVDLDALRG